MDIVALGVKRSCFNALIISMRPVLQGRIVYN